MRQPVGGPRPHALLFDLGNTLLREDAFDAEAGTERVLALARNPRGLSGRDVCGLVAQLNDDLQPRRESSLLEISPLTVHRLVYEPHEISFERPFGEIELEFWKAATRFTPTAGVRELLESLYEESLVLGVVSNSTFTSRVLSWQLSDVGLLSFFRLVMSSGDYVVRKPHPALFLTAALKLGASPGSTWFVGDSLRYDVAGAQGAGMKAVWYNPDRRPRSEVVPDLEIRSWPELPRLLPQSRA